MEIKSKKAIPCEILFLGQEEPSMELQFINIQNFNRESELKKVLITLTELMIELEQNRVVNVSTDETQCSNNRTLLDPNIKPLKEIFPN
jgi:hypothetical protein